MKSTILRPALVAAAALAVTGCTSYGGHGYTGMSYGYARATPYYGWYDGYYYPGTGYYIYDRYGGRQRWNDSHRRYWESHRRDDRRVDNWGGYHRDARSRDHRRDNDRDDRRDDHRRRDRR